MSSAATFDELVRRHERGVLRVCRAILRDEHLSADAAQDAFLRLWRRLDQGRAPERPETWLRSVAVTAALDVHRRRRLDAAPAAGEVDALPATEAEPGAALDRSELRERYEEALQRLSEGQRTVFLLRHQGGLKLSEIAEALQVGLPTVKTQFARAALRLQAHLCTYTDPSPRETER